MADVMEICNSALIKMGAEPLLNLEEPNKKAATLKLRYPLIRDAELRRRRWRFSLDRAYLAADAEAPPFTYARSFTLPARALRVIQVADVNIGLNLADYRSNGSAPFSIEGNKILTNYPAPLAVRFIQRIESPGLFDAAFVESLASRIAYECCETITQSDSKKKGLFDDYRFAIREAVAANAIERPPEHSDDDTWVLARTQ